MASKVLFTPSISGEGVLALYKALGRELTATLSWLPPGGKLASAARLMRGKLRIPLR